jgi:hypothetical protein
VNNKVLAAVIQPTGTDVVDAEASFIYAQGGPSDVIDELSCLVRVRRAYGAGLLHRHAAAVGASRQFTEYFQPKVHL